jgi:PleD family two-component response regulator
MHSNWYQGQNLRALHKSLKLRGELRSSDLSSGGYHIGRLGGDEFVVVLVDESGKESVNTVKEMLATPL